MVTVSTGQGRGHRIPGLEGCFKQQEGKLRYILSRLLDLIITNLLEVQGCSRLGLFAYFWIIHTPHRFEII